MTDVFQCAWESHIPASSTGASRRVIPDNCADFIVTDDGRSWLVGPATKVDLPAIPPGTIVRGLRIRPHALRAVVDAEPAELIDGRAGFDDLLSSRAARTLEEAILTGTLDERMLRQLWPSPTLDDRATRGIGLLGSRTDLSVDEIARECAMSPRQFRRVVRQVSGLSPKTLQRVGRMHQALDIARRQLGASLGMIATHAGYADQAHFARDVRALADLTPLELLDMHV
jgi:AraC-like DNA-binding protein